MRYSTNTSIYTMLTGLTNNSTTTGVINHHIIRVSGKIDSYVFRRYNPSGWTSLSSIPQIIQQISDALVAQYTMRSLFTRDAQNKNDWVEELAKEAKEDLEKIRNGNLPITLNQSEESTETLIDSTRKGYTPVFDMDEVINSTIDSDLLDSIADDRI